MCDYWRKEAENWRKTAIGRWDYGKQVRMERNEARKDYDLAIQALNVACEWAEQAEDERDEARRIARVLYKLYVKSPLMLSSWTDLQEAKKQLPWL